MQTLSKVASHEQLIRKSRFFARARPLTARDEPMAQVRQLALADASHNCWAWRMDRQYRFSDDGEPGGSAGRPILAAIDGARFDFVLVLVSRYFGGIKLGVGGLIRAYGGTAARCLAGAEARPLIAFETMSVALDFADTGVAHTLLARFGGRIVSEQFGADGIQWTVQAPGEQLADLKLSLIDATRGRANCEKDG